VKGKGLASEAGRYLFACSVMRGLAFFLKIIKSDFSRKAVEIHPTLTLSLIDHLPHTLIPCGLWYLSAKVLINQFDDLLLLNFLTVIICYKIQFPIMPLTFLNSNQ
jgi:hypothetical protein